MNAGRWFAVGIATPPVLDLAEDAGLVRAALTLDGSVFAATPWFIALEIALFMAVAAAAGALLNRHRPRPARWFFGACVGVLALYVAWNGWGQPLVRLSTPIAALVLILAAVNMTEQPVK